MSNQKVAYSRMLRNSLTSLSPFPFKACSERIIAFYFLALTKFSDEKLKPPFQFASMLDRVLRRRDCELVKQRNKLKNCQTNYRTKLPEKSSSPEASKKTVQFSIVHARNSSRDSQAKLMVRFVVKWREFRGNKKIATTLICYARLTQ